MSKNSDEPSRTQVRHRSAHALVFGLVAALAVVATAVYWHILRAPTVDIPAHIASRPTYHPPAPGELSLYQAGTFARGDVSGIVFAQSDSNVVYLASDGAGAFRSEDGGRTWAHISSGLHADLRAHTIAVNPHNAREVLVVTFDHVYRSKDGGRTWTQSNEKNLEAAIYDPWTAGAVYGLDTIVKQVAIGGAFPDSLVLVRQAGYSENEKLWVKEGQGGQWELLMEHQTMTALAVSAGPPLRIVATSLSDDTVFLFERASTQQRWTTRRVPLDDFVRSAAPDPSNPHGVFFATNKGIFRFDTETNALSRVELPVGAATDFTGYAVATDLRTATVLAASDADLYRSEDGGRTWKPSGTGIDIRNMRAVAALPDSPRTIVAAWDTPRVKGVIDWRLARSADGGESWTPVVGGLPPYGEISAVAPDPAVPGRLLAYVSLDAFDRDLNHPSGLWESTDRGTSWSHLSSQKWDRVAQLYLPTTRRNLVYAVANHYGTVLSRSQDGGRTFEPIAPPAVLDTSINAGSRPDIVAVAFAQTDGDALAVATTNDELFVSGNAGASWRLVGHVPGGARVTALAYAPDKLADAGLVVGSNGSLLVGGRFIEIDSSKKIEIESIYIDPMEYRVMVVCTSQGLFYTSDEGQTWYRPEGDTGVNGTSLVPVRGSPGLFLIASSAGVYYAADRIHRADALERLVTDPSRMAAALWQHRGLLLMLLSVGLSVYVLYFTTLPLQVLAQQWPLLDRLAPVAYLVLGGEWRVFRRYREALASSLAPHGEFYRSPPITIDGESDIPATESEARIASIATREIVLVTGPGGAGKSTLLRRFAGACALGTLVPNHLPVLLDLAAIGERPLFEFITDALKHWKVYINPAALEVQLARGRFLFLIDGLSEVTEAQLTTFLREAAGLRSPVSDKGNLLVLAGRHDEQVALTLGPGLAPVRPRRVRLVELETDDLANFCRGYLASLRTQDEATAPQFEVGELAHQLEGLPRTPLIIRLAVKEFNVTGRAPANSLEVFEHGLEQILRPQTVSMYAPALLYLLRHLAWAKLVDGRGTREISEGQFIELFQHVESDTQVWSKFQGQTVPAMRVLGDLLRSGVFVRLGPRVRFWHDSFEDYLAAAHFCQELWASEPVNAGARLEPLLGDRTYREMIAFIRQLAMRYDDDELARLTLQRERDLSHD